jgi:hypothetical protein
LHQADYQPSDADSKRLKEDGYAKTKYDKTQKEDSQIINRVQK